jgi:uncharacterized protein
MGVVELLLEQASMDLDACDANGRTALYLAAANGHDAAVRALLESGADIETKGSRGETSLLGAADVEKGHIDVITLLWECRAEAGVAGILGRTALYLAAWKGYTNGAGVLLEFGAEMESIDGHGLTPLHVATAAGREEVVRLLLKKGSDSKAKDGSGKTPMQLAAERGYKDVVMALVLAAN